MRLPKTAIFAFNANIDHLKAVGESDVSAIDSFLPTLASQMSESFAWGVQKEVLIDAKTASLLLSRLKFDRTIVGGQAGNATEQASALGIDCLLHTNFGNSELISHFLHKEKIFLPKNGAFAPSADFSSQAASARHFVFEHAESRTRFIASYDPLPMHIEEGFKAAIAPKLPEITKAFVGGFHLLKTPDRLQKFVDEVCRWKEINPRLLVFAELGEFQNREVRNAAREKLFPAVDMVGLNDTELSAFGCDLPELAQNTNAILFHTPDSHAVFPEEKLDSPALGFAKRCAAYKAQNGRCATLLEAEASSSDFVDSPKWTVGLGDTFSCAYFMAASATVLKQKPSNETTLRP